MYKGLYMYKGLFETSKKLKATCLFVLLLYVPVNSYGHYGMVSSPNHTFPGQS